MIYLDHCATTPLDPDVRLAIEGALDAVASGEWANPSSVHEPGRRARARLEAAREAVARFVGARPAEIVFTGSASEANSLAIHGSVLRALLPRTRPADAGGRPYRIVTSAFEHESVASAVRHAETRFPGRVEWTEVGSDESGTVRPELFEIACSDGADLVALMAVNNETGAIQPVEAVGEIARRAGARFLVDAVQAAGRLPLSDLARRCDFLALSAHKLRGPDGVGCLFVREGVEIDPLVDGGHQEGGRRAGTERLDGVIGLARACDLAAERLEADAARLGALERAFLDELAEASREASAGLGAEAASWFVNGAAPRVAGIANVSLPGATSHDLVAGMDLRGFAISAGSACSSGVVEPSRTLLSMGLPAERVASAVRVSFGRGNTESEARAAARALAETRAAFVRHAREHSIQEFSPASSPSPRNAS